MAKTKINPADVINSSSKASSAQSAVSGVVSGIYSTRWMIDSQILNRNGIGTSLGTVQGQIAQLEQDIRKISQTVENGASQYQATENWVVNLGRTVGGVNDKLNVGYTKSIYENYFCNSKGENVASVDGTLTDTQQQKIENAIKQNDMYAALQALGITNLSKEGLEVLGDMWDDLVNGILGNISKNVKDGFRDEIIPRIFQSSSSVSYSLSSFLNTATALAKGPAGESSFVILNPNIVDVTGVIAKNGSILGKVATGCKVGLPILGGVLDFSNMLNNGEKVQDAAIKSVAHVGIGVAAGAVGGKIGAGIGTLLAPGLGTVAGGIIGVAVGVVIGAGINTLCNAAFDAVYDNRNEINEFVSEVHDVKKDLISEKAEQIGKKIVKSSKTASYTLGCILG